MTDNTNSPGNTGPYRAVLAKALDASLQYMDSLDASSVGATATKDELRERLLRPLSDRGADPVAIIEDLVADTRGGLLGTAGGRFYGWVIGSAVPAALAADWLASAWDQNACLYATGPAAAIVEEACGVWLKDLLGLPETASFALVSGCQMAHVTALAAARHGLLAREGWDVEAQGLAGAPRIEMLTSEGMHGSFDRAVRLMGLGSNNIVQLPIGAGEILRPEVLREALESRARGPKIVLLQAGEINTGVFDPFAELIAIAHEHDAWVHIDGAFGLWAQVSPEHRDLLAGVHAADSWSTDGHKWLNVPFDSGFVFVADAAAHRAAMTHRAAYIEKADDARDEMDWNPEWSRRARGFATYAALRELGRDGVADLVRRNCEQARAIVTRIGALDGAEVLWEPIINQGLVRFLDPQGTDHDARTDAIVARIAKSGEAFFTPSTWRGRRCMRVSVCSWKTSAEDVDRAVEAARVALAYG